MTAEGQCVSILTASLAREVFVELTFALCHV